VQVALLSLVYNRGPSMARGSDAKKSDEDIFDSRWEMRELSRAVLFKDLVWIYCLFESMRRVWASDTASTGLIKRRDAELALIQPYIASDLQHEAFLERHAWWR